MYTVSDDLSVCFLALLEPHSRLTESESGSCYYCSRLINADDGAQRIDKRSTAHKACAFRVNDEFFTARNVKEEQDDDAA